MKRRKPESLRDRWAYFWKYRLPMYMWDTSAGTIVFCWAVLIAAFGLVMLIVWAVGLIRPAEGENLSAEVPGEGVGRSPAVVRYLGAAEDEEIGTAYILDEYTEGEAPVPGWWNPGEEMSAEWSASCQQVASKLDEAEPHPPVGISTGGIDYNLEPEVKPEWLLDVPMDRWLQECVHGLCEEEGVPFLLAMAVIEAESGYDPSAVSVCGDYGLMQINEVCHGWLGAECGVTDWRDPYQNARAGVHLLGEYWRDYGYESGTLMAYNMGREAAEALFARGIYATDYSDRVIGIRERMEARNG